jgi:hypothetical protein
LKSAKMEVNKGAGQRAEVIQTKSPALAEKVAAGVCIISSMADYY